jgi:two-component system sensor histidine kinase/response regulator
MNEHQLNGAEEVLRESEDRFLGTLENAAVGIVHNDPCGRFLRVNEKYCSIVGYSREELLQMNLREIIHGDEAVAFAELYESSFARNDMPAAGMERRYLRKDGSTIWVEVFVSFQRGVSGRPSYAISVVQDISERKHLEGELRQANVLLQGLVDGTQDAVYVKDRQGKHLMFNAAASRLVGKPIAEVLGQDDTAIFDAEGASMVMTHDRLVMESGTAASFEHELTADGVTRNYLSSKAPYRDGQGNVIGLIGICHDITERTRAEEALRQANARLRESDERFRQLAENVHGVFWLEEGGWQRLLYISPAYEEVWGRTCQSIYEQPRSWIDAVHPDDRNLVFESLERQNRGEHTEMEFRIARPDGSIRWVRYGAFPLRNQTGEVFRAAGLVEDITERKQFDDELRRAKGAAEAANRAKDDFLANVSHEIRTPMNAIIGMTELVLDTPLDEDQRQGLKTVKSAADNLLSIINDLLDFSKIEAGKLELVPADFSLRAAVGDTLRALAVRAHKKGLELIYQVQSDVPDALVGDAGRLRQVLLNLVGNAVKFTDEGEVLVRVETQGGDPSPSSEAEEVGLRFTVLDTGIGIPADQQARIFRAFEQEDTSTTRNYGGTGLGLTIASRLVSLMGGMITVDSAPGRGSSFAFTARLGRQLHPPEVTPAQSPLLLHNLPVLVVDDNATNRHILAEWLRGWQLDPTVVSDGMAAMDALWHRAANNRPYALVLLDARMPDADGLTVAAMIRERAELASTRIILLTSGERPGDPTRFRELRIDAQLLKPIQQDELLETIYQVMSRAQGAAPPWARPTAQQAPLPLTTTIPLHILVAEDNELSAQVLEQTLTRQGHSVRLSSNGREVLTLAEQGGFDLLLLDVHMPELDGFQVVRAVRERELSTGGHLPIIAFTARSRKEDRERCLAAGMDDFQTKPIRPAELLAAIDRVLQTHSSRPYRTRDLPDAPMVLAFPPTQARQSSLLDHGAISRACGGRQAVLETLCEVFHRSLPDHMGSVRLALGERNLPRLAEAAHMLYGTLAAFSTIAGALAFSLEDLAKREDLESCAELVDRLESMCRELLEDTRALAGQVDGDDRATRVPARDAVAQPRPRLTVR